MKMFRVVVNGSEYKVGIEELVEEKSTHPAPQKYAAAPAPSPKPAQSPPAPKTPPKQPATDSSAAGGAVKAPMPGTVLSIGVAAGDKVTKGQTLLILEAMKMENQIMAPIDGVIKEINVTQGVSVNAGDILVVLSS